MLECVVNISEGRDLATVSAIGAAAGADLLDTHTDPHHNRTVLTLAGHPDPLQEAIVALAARGGSGPDPRVA